MLWPLYPCDALKGVIQLKWKSPFLKTNYKWRSQGFTVALSFRGSIRDLFLSGPNCSHTVIKDNRRLLRPADYKVMVNNAFKHSAQREEHTLIAQIQKDSQEEKSGVLMCCTFGIPCKNTISFFFLIETFYFALGYSQLTML